jgi:hypothetical protein
MGPRAGCPHHITHTHIYIYILDYLIRLWGLLFRSSWASPSRGDGPPRQEETGFGLVSSWFWPWQFPPHFMAADRAELQQQRIHHVGVSYISASVQCSSKRGHLGLWSLALLDNQHVACASSCGRCVGMRVAIAGWAPVDLIYIYIYNEGCPHPTCEAQEIQPLHPHNASPRHMRTPTTQGNRDPHCRRLCGGSH